MSGTFPTSPNFSTVNLSSKHSTLESRTQSGKRQVRQIGGHLWSFTAKYPQMTRSEFMPVFAFSMSQQGRCESFQIIPPDLATPQGVATGTPVVEGVHTSGNSITTDGWTPGITGIMKAGDIMKFAGHNKVYMVTADANSNADDPVLDEASALLLDEAGATIYDAESNRATLTVEPALAASLADNESITVTNVPFTMAFTNDVQQYGGSAPILYNFEIDLIEVL